MVGRWPGRSGNREKINKEGVGPVKAKHEKDALSLRSEEQQPWGGWQTGFVWSCVEMCKPCQWVLSEKDLSVFSSLCPGDELLVRKYSQGHH